MSAPTAEPDLDPEESEGSKEPEQPAERATRGRRRRGPSPRSRAGAGLLAVVVAVVLACVAWSVPAARTVLLQSFTKQSSSFTELYFTSDPSFDGATVVVPVSLNAHGTGVESYQIRLTLESPSGEALATTTLNLEPRDGTPMSVVAHLQAKADVTLVRASLVGHPQTLHFHFGKPQTPNS